MADLKLNSISKEYGSNRVLNEIDLDIKNGEFIVVVGPSGCGKSTILKLLSGLEEPSSGSIEIDSRDVTGLEPVERGIAMVFQSYALYPHMTVFENIAFPLRIQKMDSGAIDDAVRNAAQILDLTDRLSFKPSELSGGQRQRVAIGRAIVRAPKVFLFDEPLSNLDASLRAQMRIELSELHRNLKTTMIYVTHDQVEAMTMADRIVVLRDGCVEQFGTPMELYSKPNTRFVASFIGQPGMNFIPVDLTWEHGEAKVSTPDGFEKAIPLAAGSLQEAGPHRVEMGIRPEHLRMTDSYGGLEAEIRVVERLGHTTIVHSRLGDGTEVVASFEGGSGIPDVGMVRLDFDINDVRFFDSGGRAIFTDRVVK